MKSMKAKLIALTAAFLILFGTVFTVIAYTKMRAELVEDVANELTSTTTGYVTFVKNWYSSKLQQALAGMELVKNPEPIPFLTRLAQGAGYDLMYIGTADHRMLRSDNKPQPQGYDPVARPWYQMAAKSGKPGVSDPYVDFDTKKLVVTFVAPVSEGGSVKAVVGGDIFIDGLVKTVLDIKLRGNGFAFLVDQSGKVIAHPNQALTLKPLSETVPALTAEKLNSAAASKELLEVDIDGTPHFVQVMQVEGTPWILGIVVDKNIVLEPLGKLLITIVGLGLLVMVVLVPVVSMILGSMLAGLGRLSRAMREIAQGEGDLTRRMDVSGQDEIADTARSFNLFVEHLQQMFLSVRSEASSVISGVEEVSSTVEKVADDSRSISDVSSSNAATLEEITVSISHIADAAREADGLVTKTGDYSHASAKDMEQISREMNRTVDAVKGLSSMLATLDNRSQQITGITNVIKDIADQTNLLALNAAIEAARAGEMGRGFAVVADEVRKLAERTAQATVEITAMVNTIREETSQAVANMQNTVTSVDDGVVLTRDAVERISKIQDAMEEVVAKMNEINLSTTEQHKATTMIAQSTERINGRILDSDTALQGVHDTLLSLKTAASSMRQTFSRFKV
ncbi:methyl-accepting chemotaxis protein [Paludibacterium paludis]|uniref:Methyl-accepting chemotaxis protein n=2 Tax=Paludibacterium paludis TaxID=1225769 RepID=A0A918P3F7_9NEIS|nr:methyl-accepting chemotaxis protein [Paludibacterium paludis]